MKKTKTLIFTTSTILVLSFALIQAFAGIFPYKVRAGFNVTDIEDFTYTDGYGNTYKCFETSPGSREIEIGWGLTPSETPKNLTVHETFTHGSVDYTVVGIVQGGFRYCDFETITLPNTISIIEEEAFAYCTAMKSFTLPYNVSRIEASTFMDCRSMETFFYYNSTGVTVVTNDVVEHIGDHAFDSCVSLNNFTCSTKLTYFGESSFQNCKALTRFYFPSKTGTGDDINYIDVKKYAFADCENLVWVYFENNLRSVENFAYADCNEELLFHYGYEGSYVAPSFEEKWIRMKIETGTTDEYGFTDGHELIRQDDEYPGLKFMIQDSIVYLDGSNETNNSKKTRIFNKNNEKVKYAVINEWIPPLIADPDKYYNVGTHALTIPNTVTYDGVEYPVVVIGAGVFANKADKISSVKFKPNLVQICHNAFYKDTLISNFDFSEATGLIEISYGIVNDKTSNTYNDKCGALALPNNLEYIGRYAFYRFSKCNSLSFKTDNTAESHLKVIGGLAFARIAEDLKTNSTLDIVLPCSLDDDAAKKAKLNVAENNDYNNINWAAVGPYALGAGTGNESSCVRSVTMEECTNPNHDHSTQTCSLASNAFNRARYLVKFVASSNLCMIGNECFKNCERLREVFLTTQRAADKVAEWRLKPNRTSNCYPWGTKVEDGSSYEQSVFSGGDKTTKEHLVIYLDGDAPGDINKIDSEALTAFKCKWNAESSKSYVSEVGYQIYDTTEVMHHSRSEIPTVYNVDFNFNSGSILYYNTRLKKFLLPEEAPVFTTDYEEGLIVFAKSKNSNDYTAVHYWLSSKNSTSTVKIDGVSYPPAYQIDLTGLTLTLNGQTINVSANLKTIGEEAFGSLNNQNYGFYFILPDTITKIGERAFFRKASDADNGIASSGVRIVTYKKNGVIQPSDAEYAAAKSACDNGSPGYCILPTGLERVERNAFYGNNFATAKIGPNLEFIGKSLFYTHCSVNGVIRSQMTSIEVETGATNYGVVNGGLYYTGAKKTLLYQVQNVTGNLTIDSGTVAIGMDACANTSYTKITLDSGLKTIYGGAFAHNQNLEEVVTVDSIEYIGSVAANDDTWNSNLPFDVIDYRNLTDGDKRANIESRKSAFQDCPILATMNFKTMTNLKKIGHVAFRGCSSLTSLTGGDSYSYYTWNGSALSSPTTVSNTVLDMSGMDDLVSIGREAFVDCNGIKYFHFPDSDGDLMISYDTENVWSSDGKKIDTDKKGKIFGTNDKNKVLLMGDTANDANATYSSTSAYSRKIFNTVWYGDKTNIPYYHAADSSEILTVGSVSGVRYWAEHPTDSDGYVLLEGSSKATSYFTWRLTNYGF